MATLLGREVVITNTKALRFAKERGLNTTAQFEALDVIDMMDLIAYCSDIPIKDLEDALDEDISFKDEIIKTINDGYETGKKQMPKPMKKIRR